MEDVEAIVAKLTKAQRHAVVEGANGYYDDNSLTGSERAMFYRLIERKLFEHPFGTMMGGRRPDIALTPLGLRVRTYLLSQTKE